MRVKHKCTCRDTGIRTCKAHARATGLNNMHIRHREQKIEIYCSQASEYDRAVAMRREGNHGV